MRILCSVYVKGDTPETDEVRRVRVHCAESETLVDVAYRAHV